MQYNHNDDIGYFGSYVEFDEIYVAQKWVKFEMENITGPKHL